MPHSQFRVHGLGNHRDAYLSIAAEALLCPDQAIWETYLRRIGEENVRVITDGDAVVGGLAYYRVKQWFGGKAVGVAGVSGVAVDPVFRGAGACETLLRETMSELRSDGVALACLYASTQRLYRKVGFQQAGSRTLYSIPIASLGRTDSDIPIRRYKSPPLDELQHVAENGAQFGNGNFQRNEALWERVLEPMDGIPTLTYLVGSEDDPIGYVILKSGTRGSGVPAPLVATDVAATNGEAIKRIINLIHDHRSMCDRFQWFGSPDDPILFFAQEQNVSIEERMQWLLRVLDVEAALTQRGYPRNLKATLHLEIQDDTLAENHGCWCLHVDEGNVTMQRGGDGTIRLDVRTLAAMYTSFLSASQLAQMGLVQTQDPTQLTIADQVFSGPAPWMTEIF